MGAQININDTAVSRATVAFGSTVTLLNDAAVGPSQKWEVISPRAHDGATADFTANFSGWTVDAGSIASWTQTGSYPAVTFKVDQTGTYFIRLTSNENPAVVDTAIVRVAESFTGEHVPAPGEGIEDGVDGWARAIERHLKVLDRRAFGHVRVVNQSGASIARGRVVRLSAAVDAHVVAPAIDPGGSAVEPESVPSISLADPSASGSDRGIYAVLDEAIANGAFGWAVVSGLFESRGDVTYGAASTSVYFNSTGVQTGTAPANAIAIGTVVVTGSSGVLWVDGGHANRLATTSVAGLMSAADKTKLDGLSGGGGGGGSAAPWVFKTNVSKQTQHIRLWPNFWDTATVDFGKCWWEAVIALDSNPIEGGDGNGYIVSDGYGGGHAILWGYFGGVPSGNMLFGGTPKSFGGHGGVAIGEWHHHAVCWDRTAMITYINGVPCGYVATEPGLTRDSSLAGCNVAYIGGSDHSNLPCRIAHLVAFDDDHMPIPPSASMQAFIPSRLVPRIFGHQNGHSVNPTRTADLVMAFSGPAGIVPDLSPKGCRGTHHPGIVETTYALGPSITGINAQGGNATPMPRSPLPWFTQAPDLSTGDGHIVAPAEGTRTPAAVPSVKTLIWDSFERPNQTYFSKDRLTLGSTEGGSLGPRPWVTDRSSFSTTESYILDKFGILNGKVFPCDQYGAPMAWVEANRSDNYELSVKRETGAWYIITPGGTAQGSGTGLIFRCIDNANYWTVGHDPWGLPNEVYIGHRQGGVGGPITRFVISSAGVPAHWLVMKVRVQGTTIKVFLDNIQIGEVTGATQLQSATKVGIIRAYWQNEFNSLYRWDDFRLDEFP